jgi:YVTN family beta-propeller protein
LGWRACWPRSLSLARNAQAQPTGTPWSAYVADYGAGTVPVIDNQTGTVTATITLGNSPRGVAVTPDQAPDARLTVTPAPAGQATAFNASASTVKYGTIASYQWDFGDGTTQTTTTLAASHTYTAPGHYTATLTETSSGGTSITRVFTGQTVSRNGGPQARTTATVTIGPVSTPAPTITPTVTPTVKPTVTPTITPTVTPTATWPPMPWVPVTG